MMRDNEPLPPKRVKWLNCLFFYLFFIMALKYKVQETVSKLKNKEGEAIAYARPVYTNEADINSLAELIADISAISVGDVRSMLYTLTKLVAKELSNGRLVSLGDLGRLRLTLRSKSAKKAEDFKNDMIKGVGVIFTPGKAIKLLTKDISLECVGSGKKPEKKEKPGETEKDNPSEEGI